MSKFMHKVRDAVTSHLHSQNKGSRHDSAKMEDTVNDAGDPNRSSNMGTGNHGSSDYNAPTMGANVGDAKMQDTGNTYGATSTSTGNYGQAGKDPMMGDTMRTGDSYGSTNAGFGGTGSQGSNNLRDSSRMTSGMNDTSQGSGTTGAGMAGLSSGAYHDSKMNQHVEPGRYGSTQQPSYSGSESYGASALDSAAYESQNRAGNISMGPGNYSSAGGYGSGNMESGSRRNESMMANKMDPSLDNSPRNRENYGGSMASTTAPTGQVGGYSSNYGALRGSGMDSEANEYNTGSSNMANPIQNRAEQEISNRTGQEGFGGAAAGGSSYNDPKISKRRSSAPHSSNLLNKLDPRVHSSDYKDNTTGNQRGY